MKRLFIIASLAILAVGCQKTEIQNEVQTPIGFSTETGKLTRAIADGQTTGATTGGYLLDQPFGVYAYGWQKESDGSQVTDGAAGALVMDNLEVTYTPANNQANPATPAKWAVNSSTKYYWPNDPRTTLNFYAFSPYIQRPDNTATTEVNEASQAASKADVPDKVMTVTSLTHSEDAGLQFTGYVHSNMYVDFMEATPVLNATYSDSNGTATAASSAGVVPMTFNHKMTQVVFNVNTKEPYPGITFTIQSIELKNVRSQADYGQVTENQATVTKWKNQVKEATPRVYTIFPATGEREYALSSTGNTTLTTTGVTMIPQDMVKVTGDVVAGTDTYKSEANSQMFVITYKVEGTGVATETIVKHVPFYAYSANSVVNWEMNKKISYTVTIGLNEITFEPSVAEWTPTEGETYDFQQ